MMMPKARVQRFMLGASAAAVIAVAGAAVASGAFAANNKDKRTAASTGHPRAILHIHRVRAHSAGQPVDAAFPALARSAAPSDALPPSAVAGNPATLPFQSGQSRSVGSVPGGQAWLAPATNGGVCLIVSSTNSLGAPQSAGACTDASDATSAGIGLSSSTASWLVLPVGSSAVSVVNPTGATSTLAPNSNGLVTIAGPYKSASYTGPDGSSHTLPASITATAAAPASDSRSAP
jgi:hypothetical protein